MSSTQAEASPTILPPITTLKDTPAVSTPAAMPVWKRAWRNIRRNSHLLLAELTIGFPFIGYKLMASLLLKSAGVQGGAGISATEILAAFFLVLAIVDLAFNLSNLMALVFVGHRLGPVCLLSWICSHTPLKRRYNDIGEALDTMLSFSIVAVVVGVNLFPNLIAMSPADGPKVYFILWNTCTVANVLGAGIARLHGSVRHSKVLDRMEKKG